MSTTTKKAAPAVMEETIRVRVNRKLKDRVARLARAQGINSSILARKAIVQFVENYGKSA